MASNRLVQSTPGGADERRRLIHAHRARQAQPSVGKTDRARLRRLELVCHATEKLADDVLERDEPDDNPLVIDHKRLVIASLAEEREKAIGRHRLRDANEGSQQRGTVKAPAWSTA